LSEKEPKLSDYTLKVYAYMLRRNPIPVNIPSISEELKISRGAAQYAIRRLLKEDLIEETLDGYVPKKFVRVSWLKFFVYVHFMKWASLIPRLLVYSVVLLFITVSIIITARENILKIILVIPCIILLILCLEEIKAAQKMLYP